MRAEAPIRSSGHAHRHDDLASAAREKTSTTRETTDVRGTACGTDGGNARSRERREEAMPRRMPHAYVDGSGAARRLLEENLLTLEDLVAELDPDREDPLAHPWRRRDRAAIRRALGH
jgi:hypothetical protein